MTRATLDSFESALLTELRTHVTERAVSGPARQPIGRRIAALAAAAAVASVAVTGIVGLRPDPAFAVEPQAGGDVVVTVIKLSDAEGLERALAKEGVTAEVTYDATAMTPSDLDNGERSAVCAPIGVVTDPTDNGGVTFTLDAEYVAAHDTVLHLTAAGGRSSNDWIAVSVVWEDSDC